MSEIRLIKTTRIGNPRRLRAGAPATAIASATAPTAPTARTPESYFRMPTRDEVRAMGFPPAKYDEITLARKLAIEKFKTDEGFRNEVIALTEEHERNELDAANADTASPGE